MDQLQVDVLEQVEVMMTVAVRVIVMVKQLLVVVVEVFVLGFETPAAVSLVAMVDLVHVESIF